MALPTERLGLMFPDFPVAGLPESGRIANGRGISKEACRSSCRGELTELASCCWWGDEQLVTASFDSLGPQAIPPEKLIGLSPRQYRERAAWNDEFGWYDWRPRPASPTDEIEWIRAADAWSGEHLFIPAETVLIGRREPGDMAAFAIADSNGCASGATLAEAKLNALMELIERDAVSRWWYGKQAFARVDLSSWCRSNALLEYLSARSRICCLLKLSGAIPVSVFAAVTFEADGSDVAIGSAAAADPAGAAQSALIEALQMEIALNAARRHPGASRAWDRWRADVTIATPPLSSIANMQGWAAVPPEAMQLDDCIRACHEAGISIYWVDMTRPRLGLPTLRILSTDLCFLKPRFGRARLLAQPYATERDLDGHPPLLV